MAFAVLKNPGVSHNGYIINVLLIGYYNLLKGLIWDGEKVSGILGPWNELYEKSN